MKLISNHYAFIKMNMIISGFGGGRESFVEGWEGFSGGRRGGDCRAGWIGLFDRLGRSGGGG